MAIDADILAILSVWDETIISKPQFHLTKDIPTNPQFNTQDMKKRPKLRPIPTIHHVYINAKQKGKLNAEKGNFDNSTDICMMDFELIYSESNEDDAVLMLKVMKKLLHRSNIAAGHYHIDEFFFDNSQQITTVSLIGHRFQSLEDDAF